MAGKKGSVHRGWESREHISRYLAAFFEHDGNCRRAAKALDVTHQQLRWVWVRAGLQPRGTKKIAIPNHIVAECGLSPLSSVAKKYGIPRSTLRRRYNEENYGR